jgi:Skp family chaperone for outer membrane proteins
MNKTERVLLYATAILVLFSTGYVVKQLSAKQKIVYVDIGKLLEGYQLKKDLEAEGSQNLYKIKNVADSLKMMQKAGAGAQVDSQLQHAEGAFNEYYSYYSQEVSKKVWERLNPLLEQFGKERQLELVIGANGAGTVLYGSKQSDITEEAIKYINEHYKKGN